MKPQHDIQLTNENMKFSLCYVRSELANQNKVRKITNKKRGNRKCFLCVARAKNKQERKIKIGSKIKQHVTKMNQKVVMNRRHMNRRQYLSD